jgi:two-component system, sporulation sensor kinase E
MQKGNFEGKFLSKLSKIDKQEIEGFLAHLVREKNFLEIIFNSMLDGIVVLRPNLEVMYTNNAALELLDINPRRRIVGERISEICENTQFKELVARFAIRREQTANREIESSGEPQRVLAVSIIPLQGDAGRQSGSVIIIIHDVTEARQHAEEKRRAERATTLATLSAGLAHEIKNPLNSLQIHAQLLEKALRGSSDRRKMDKARAQQSSHVILEEIQRLSGVVDQFLSAVRPTRPLFQRASINSIVQRVAATLGPEAEERGVRLSVALDHDIPFAEFDPNQLAQALLNLVKNALESFGDVSDRKASDQAAFSPRQGFPSGDGAWGPGTRQPTVEMRTELKGSEICVHVIDNGPGMPEEDLKKIFEPYYTTKFSGTGLGLAIVSRIIEEHKGRMDLTSKPGQGTMVSLVLPLESRPVRLLESGLEPHEQGES